MSNAMSLGEKPIFFLADAHLTTRRVPEEMARERRVAGFLAYARDHASHVYILGDLFDFWFEYRHALPGGHFQLYRRLYELAEAGVRTTFLAGNHDFWCLQFLAREFGIETHPDPIEVTHQGRRIWLAHGDGLIRKDWGYRALRRILRNRLCIAAYRIVHPDLGIPLAHDSSTTSRNYTEERDIDWSAYWDEVVIPRFSEGYDAVLMGHIHVPTHRQRDGKDFFFVGDWMGPCTFVSLSGGRFQHLRWETTGPEPYVETGSRAPASRGRT